MLLSMELGPLGSKWNGHDSSNDGVDLSIESPGMSL